MLYFTVFSPLYIRFREPLNNAPYLPLRFLPDDFPATFPFPSPLLLIIQKAPALGESFFDMLGDGLCIGRDHLFMQQRETP